MKQDYKKAMELYQKACDLGGADACYDVASLYLEAKGVEQNFKTAKEYFGKACDLGDQFGCDDYKKLNEAGY